MRVIAISILLAFAALAKEPPVWVVATVLDARYTQDAAGVVASRGGTIIAHGQFEFDAGAAIYNAEEYVSPNTALRLKEGEEVQIAVEKKTLLLKLPGGKTRRMKLTSTTTKSRR